jgi:RNA polymerase sigma factor (TIGR02999 family)
MSPDPGEVTRLLIDLQEGKPEAENLLLPMVYDELRRLARSYLRRERPDHTLQATALVHEAYIKLAGQKGTWQNRSHFFGVAAQVMRRILVDYARSHGAAKRGSGGVKVQLDEALPISAAQSRELLDVDAALTRLEAVDPRQARVVELRFYAGLSIEETAEVLSCATRTVTRDWRMAQAWLRRELNSAGSA